MSYVIPGRWAALARSTDALDPRVLLQAVGGELGFLSADGAALVAAGFRPKLVERLLSAPDEPSPDPFYTIGSPGYPEALLSLAQPPALVCVRGAPIGDRPGLAVVGARACTPYGRVVARRLGAQVANLGGALVSGAARGVDESAHRGALEEGGVTVAVLGQGLCSRASGPEARRLHEDILRGGGSLVSELPPRDPPSKITFPRRNRLIAALARATVVVEASLLSGAIHTAKAARDLSREVWAVPGRIDAPASAGCLLLIAEGCLCVRELPEVTAGWRRVGQDPAARLLGALDAPRGLTEIAARLDAPLREVLGLLTKLELTGAVVRLPDQRYALS
ncbi:DNA-protecting protein DprA [Myxococcota bacterium]|nr:DNA-protecting protein DprA [Myxococcota bacterium]